MKTILRYSMWLVTLSALVGACSMPQSLTIEPPRTKVCWVVLFPGRWRFTAEQRRLYETADVTVLEFRRHAAADGEILVSASAFTAPPIYSANAFWISITGTRRPRLATPQEWANAEPIRDVRIFAADCKTDPNGAACGEQRFDRSHTTPRIGEIGVTAYQSPDGRWLALNGWDGQLLFQGNSGILGGFPGSGGIGGARGHQFVDLFDFKTARRIATAGGNFNGGGMGVFMHSVYWLPPHYLLAELDKSNRRLLFCNPALAETSQ